MEVPGNHYKILAITLARGGSKGIPNKNIININNKPLIYYTLKEAKKCKFINDYIVSTDSLKIKKIAEKYKVEVPFIRPKKYSSDNSSSVSALIHATKFMEKYKGYKFMYNKKNMPLYVSIYVKSANKVIIFQVILVILRKQF